MDAGLESNDVCIIQGWELQSGTSTAAELAHARLLWLRVVVADRQRSQVYRAKTNQPEVIVAVDLLIDVTLSLTRRT